MTGPHPSTENDAVLVVVQALAGLPGPDWDAVTVDVEGARLLVRVWLDDPEAAAEDLRDLASELDALVTPDVEVVVEARAGTVRPYDRSRHGRIVLLRRASDA